MGDRPDAGELVEAVFEFLAGEVLPAADDHRLKFRTLVAMNALGIARRELEAEALAPASAELATRIRAEGADPALLPELKAHVAAKLRISNPAYLERYERICLEVLGQCRETGRGRFRQVTLPKREINADGEGCIRCGGFVGHAFMDHLGLQHEIG